MLKVLFVIADFTGCGEYRCIKPAKELTKQGMIEADYSISIRPEHMKYYDLFVFQRAALPNMKEIVTQLKRRKRPILYEIDDDLFTIPFGNDARHYFSNDKKQTAKDIMKMCDGVITTTSYLKEKIAKSYNKNVYVIPNYLDKNLWQGVEKEKNNKLTIGWAGTTTHYGDLRTHCSTIKQMLNQHDIEARFIGFVPPDFVDEEEYPNLLKVMQNLVKKEEEYQVSDRVKFVPFGPYNDYPRKLAKIDIGLAPIEDNQFNRSKSDIKILEYNYLGIPCVASKVENYVRAAEDGAGVLIAKNPSKWIQHLNKLIIDESFRDQIIEKGKDWATKRWVQDNVYQWMMVFADIMKNYPFAEQIFGPQPKPNLLQDEEEARQKMEKVQQMASDDVIDSVRRYWEGI